MFAKIVVFLGLFFFFLIPLLSNFSKADNRRNVLTEKYGEDLLASTEPNAIILLSGDVANFAARFVQTFEAKGDQRIIFTPGQFHLKWFTKQLKERYPDLVIPEPQEGKRFTTTTQIAQANLEKRPVYISPELAFYDPEVEREFILWPKGLLFKLGRRGEEGKVEAYREESDKLWQSLDLSAFNWIRQRNPVMEDVLIGYYSRHFHNLGYMFDSVKLYQDAIRNYERALQIEPKMADSLKSLGLIYGFKLEPRDPSLAVNYLVQFIAVADPSRGEEIGEARYTIAKIIELEQQKYASPSGEIASQSGETK